MIVLQLLLYCLLFTAMVQEYLQSHNDVNTCVKRKDAKDFISSTP